MKFTVERDSFHDALSACLRRTKGGPDIPILSHVLVEAGDKRVTITGHDLGACSVVGISAEVAQPGSAAIPADRLHRLTSGLAKGSTIALELVERAATVKCGRSRYQLSTLPATDFPNVMEPKDDAASLALSRDQVIRLLDVPAVAIGREESRPYLSGICLHPNKGGITACATNGHTLIRTIVKGEFDDFPKVIVPRESAKEIASFAKDGEVTLRISKQLISVHQNDRSFISKLIDAEFPDYVRVIPQGTGVPVKLGAQEFDASLARLVAACDPDKSAVVLLAWSKPGEMNASLQSTFGKGAELLDADLGDREPGEIGAQIEYLRSLIEAAKGDTFELDITGPGDPIRITTPAHDDFVAVCMPCRV